MSQIAIRKRNWVDKIDVKRKSCIRNWGLLKHISMPFIIGGAIALCTSHAGEEGVFGRLRRWNSIRNNGISEKSEMKRFGKYIHLYIRSISGVRKVLSDVNTFVQLFYFFIETSLINDIATILVCSGFPLPNEAESCHEASGYLHISIAFLSRF